jgi:ATPase subunit of ABC transporter with duplicated ATPase domains
MISINHTPISGCVMKYAKTIGDTKKSSQKKIETEKLIEKFRAKASKASMAQSMIKKLDKIDH